MYVIEEFSFAGASSPFYLDSIFFFCSDKKKKKKRLIENEEDEEAGVTNPSMVSSRGGLWIRVGITSIFIIKSSSIKLKSNIFFGYNCVLHIMLMNYTYLG